MAEVIFRDILAFQLSVSLIYQRINFDFEAIIVAEIPEAIYSLDLNSSLVNESLQIKWRFKYTEDFGYLEETCNQFIG